MKPTDQELQKIARECYDKVFYNNCNKPDYIPHATIIANYLKQVRDAQDEKMKWITSEIKCRIDHGAESNGHLEGLLKIIEERK